MSSLPDSRPVCTQELFDEADTNGDGVLQLEELRGILRKASKEFTHLEEHSQFLDRCAWVSMASEQWFSWCLPAWLILKERWSKQPDPLLRLDRSCAIIDLQPRMGRVQLGRK